MGFCRECVFWQQDGKLGQCHKLTELFNEDSSVLRIEMAWPGSPPYKVFTREDFGCVLCLRL